MAQVGRPTEFTDSIAERILLEIADGKSLREICKSDEFPSRSTVTLWVLKGRGGDERYSAFSVQYAQAVEIRAHELFDEMFEIADDGANDWMERNGDGDAGWQANGEHIQRSRLRIDTRKWALSKMLPKQFGDRLETHNTHDVSDPMKELLGFVATNGKRVGGE